MFNVLLSRSAGLHQRLADRDMGCRSTMRALDCWPRPLRTRSTGARRWAIQQHIENPLAQEILSRCGSAQAT